LDAKQPYVLIYLPENSMFVDDYPMLGFKKIDFRRAVVPMTKIPRTRMTADVKRIFKGHGLFAYSSTMKLPERQNLLYDLSYYIRAIDETYKPSNYRQRSGFLIKNLIIKAFSTFPDNYKKVLMYSVRTDFDLNPFVGRKIFPVLQQLRSGQFPFDHLMLATVSETTSRYRMLVKNREFTLPKVIMYIKTIKTIDVDKEAEEETKEATNIVIKKVIDNIQPKNRKVFKDAVKSYLKKEPSKTEKLTSKEAKPEEIEQIAIASMLFRSSNDINRATRISKTVPKAKRAIAIKAIDKNFADELLEKDSSKSTSEDVAIQITSADKMVDNKTPEHLFQKRQVDFRTNLTKDMTNSFKVLGTKEIPLEVSNVTISDKPVKKSELNKSDISVIRCKLKDEFGNVHEIELDIPKIDEKSGTFRVNGNRKCLINQIVLCPISFPKPYDSKFESSYSAFHIRSKRTKRMNYLEIYLASYTLPFSIVMFYSFGFEEMLKEYEITHTIGETKPSKDQYGTQIGDNSYIIFGNVDSTLKEEFCKSFMKANVSGYRLKRFKFGTKEYFNELIIQMAGRMNSTFLINSNLENIVDPVSKQVLINMQLPFELKDIMKYMSEKVVTGYSQPRNDLSNQRIRNSEVLVHLAQKRILAAYTEYKEKVLAGNKEAEFAIPQDAVFRDFNMLQVVAEMEYANPIEEMATLTRITPVGKGIGGIPDKRAFQLDARNVHPTYFGNIDPLDTSESDNIGITQHLTVDAMITSARGLFGIKEMKNIEASGILSTSASIIPFIENNEGARIIMAANQSRQAVPLKNPEPPVVQSGYESLLTNVLSDNYIKRSPCSGKVTEVAEDHITIHCKEGKKQTIDITPVHLHSGAGKNTLSVFNPIVKKGQVVKPRSVLAEGSCISQGTISMGRTLCTASMPYGGYNFEDGIVINSRLVENDSLTSLHGVEDEILISESDRLMHIIEPGVMTVAGEHLLRKTVGEIEELIGFEEEEDDSIEISSGQLIKKSPGGKIVEIDVFSNLPPDKFPELKTLAARTSKKYGRTGKEKFTIKGITIKGILVRFRIEQELKIGTGDKLCNRYGAKGVIGLIEDEKKMPKTPWGEPIDIILNPIGTIGRMNIGQLYELYTGLISRTLADMMIQAGTQTKCYAILKRILPILDTSKNKQFSTKFLSNFKGMSKQMFLKMMQQISKTKFLPVIIPPFKAPSYKDILDVMRILKLKTGYKINLPRYNIKTVHPVPIGYTYIYKLEHIAKSKIHSRSTGPVVQKTKQPTGGKRREGGQRMGEGDTYCLISYNCTNLLAELMRPLSDDHVTKNEIISDIVRTGSAPYRAPKVSPARDLLNSYFIALMLE